MENNTVFCSFDGDGIGSATARATLANDVAGLKETSRKINLGNKLVKDFVIKNGGEIINFGGDEGDFTIPLKAVSLLEKLRTDYAHITGATVTIGVGSKLNESAKARMVGKLRGKNQTLQYSPEVEAEYKKAEELENAGLATGEAKKIGDAYMKKDDKKEQLDEELDSSPEQDNSEEQSQDDQEQPEEHDDCPYCSHEGNELEEEEECPYCAEGAEDEEGQESDCPYCEEGHSEEEHVHDDSCPHCQELDAEQAAQAGDEDPRLQSNDEVLDHDNLNPTPSESDENPPINDGENDPNAEPDEPTQDEEYGADEHKNPEEILDQFDETYGLKDPSEEDDKKYEDTDDTGIAEAGTGQEDNISRPDDFNEEIPMDSEDPVNTDGSQGEPDYSEVLRDDLNNNADEIQKQKVGDMVRNALTSFKNSKQFLEQAQQQAPDFYQSNIMMLRAMIEMAKLLGFNGPKQEEQSPGKSVGQELDEQMGQEGQPGLGDEEQELLPEDNSPDPSNPFPVHPDNGGEPQDDGEAPQKTDWSDPFPAHPGTQQQEDSGKK